MEQEIVADDSLADAVPSKQYEKKADWAERFALALFASLVLGQLVQEYRLRKHR